MKTALVLWFALLVAVSSGILVVEALANPSSYVRLFDNVVIRVQSPQNRTYTERNIPLNFTVETNNEEQLKTRYILNKEKPVDVATPVISTRTETGWYGDGSAERNYTFNYPRYTAQGTAILGDLSNGTYNLTIQRYFFDSVKPEGVTVINATSVIFAVGIPLPEITPSLENSSGSGSTGETEGALAAPWSPYIEVAVSVAFLVVAAVAGLVYWKKRKR